jgi:exonuclease III
MKIKFLSHISIASWNIQGIKSKEFNKITDPIFIREIQKHHIIALQETHCLPESHIHVKGYHPFLVNRLPSRHKAHGGQAFLVKEELFSGIQFIEGQTKDIAWLRLKKEFFELPKDMYIATIYMSPINSTFSKKLDYNPFDIIEHELTKYVGLGDTILMGDFNARTSISPDFVIDESLDYVPIPPIYTPDAGITQRCSQDQNANVCQYGRQLLELCKTSGLKIANGRVLGDSGGRFTCHKYNGSSVVDYILAEHTTLSKFLYLTVDELLGDLTDHCKISFALSVHVQQSNCITQTQQQSRKIPGKFIWNPDAKEKIKENLASESNQSFFNNLLLNNITDIDDTIESFNSKLYKAQSSGTTTSQKNM